MEEPVKSYPMNKCINKKKKGIPYLERGKESEKRVFGEIVSPAA